MFMVNLFICIEFTLINGMVSPTELLNYTPKKIADIDLATYFLFFYIAFYMTPSVFYSLFTCLVYIFILFYRARVYNKKA